MSGRFAVTPIIDTPPNIDVRDTLWRCNISDMAFDASFP